MILSRFAALFVSLTQKVSLFQNHDGRAASSVAFDAGTAELVLTTHDAWVTREEVFINYGDFSPSEFLTGYGFVPRAAPASRGREGEPSERRGRAATIDLGLPPPPATSAAGRMKAAVLAALGPGALTLTAADCLLHLGNRSTYPEASGGSSPLSLRLQRLSATDFEIDLLETLGKELRAREGRYATTLEQDEEQLVSGSEAAELPRLRALLPLLVGEKQLLRGCAERVAEALMRAKLRKVGVT